MRVLLNMIAILIVLTTPAHADSTPPTTASPKVCVLAVPLQGATLPTSPGTQFGDERWEGHSHEGIDIAGRPNQPVLSATVGVVVTTGTNLRWGRYVIVNGPDGLRWEYVHVASTLEAGDKVAKGELVGHLSTAGIKNAGPHLHLTVRNKDGKAIDPVPLLERANGCKATPPTEKCPPCAPGSGRAYEIGRDGKRRVLCDPEPK